MEKGQGRRGGDYLVTKHYITWGARQQPVRKLNIGGWIEFKTEAKKKKQPRRRRNGL